MTNTTAALTLDIDKLISDVINIPCRRDDASFCGDDSRLLYKEGHRDARHDACDLIALARQQPAVSGAGEVASGGTPEIDALMAKWDDDGATRGSAFIELRDKARQIERCFYAAVEAARELVNRSQLAAAPAAPHAQAEPVNSRLLVDIATAVMDQLGFLEGVNEHETQELCEALNAAFSKTDDIVDCAAPIPQEAEQAAPAAVMDLEALPLHYLEGVENGGYFLATDVIRWNMLRQPAAPAVTDAARDVLADAKEDEA